MHLGEGTYPTGTSGFNKLQKNCWVGKPADLSIQERNLGEGKTSWNTLSPERKGHFGEGKTLSIDYLVPEQGISMKRRGNELTYDPSDRKNIGKS